MNSIRAANNLEEVETHSKLSLEKLFDYYLIYSAVVDRKYVTSTLFFS